MRLKLCALMLIVTMFTLSGCGPSALQIQAEIAFYEAIASIQKNQAAQPIFKITATDPTKAIMMDNVASIEVYAQPSEQAKTIPQYVQRDYNAPAWQFATALVSTVTPWVGVGVLAHEFRNMQTGSQTYYNNNVGQGATGNLRVQGNTSATSSGGGAATATGMTDATSTPTVVNPVIVEQPAPIIVNQPEPIIVKP